MENRWSNCAIELEAGKRLNLRKICLAQHQSVKKGRKTYDDTCDYYVNPWASRKTEIETECIWGNCEALKALSSKSRVKIFAHMQAEKSKAIKIKVGANKLCGKVSDNKKKVKSFIPFSRFCLSRFSSFSVVKEGKKC